MRSRRSSTARSIDLEVAWFQSRYDKAGPGGGGADYINCPLDRDQYEAFVDALLAGEKAEFKEWEASTPYFEGCLPIEVMAARGRETLRFGPMKPVGLTDPRTGRRPHAVVQLRQDNALGNALQYGRLSDQAEAWRAGARVPHDPGPRARPSSRGWAACTATPSSTARACWISTLRMKAAPHVRFAGQLTGCEGYVESAAVGLMAGRFAAAEALGRALEPPPPETAHGALLAHITGGADGRRPSSR